MPAIVKTCDPPRPRLEPRIPSGTFSERPVNASVTDIGNCRYGGDTTEIESSGVVYRTKCLMINICSPRVNHEGETAELFLGRVLILGNVISRDLKNESSRRRAAAAASFSRNPILCADFSLSQTHFRSQSPDQRGYYH
jgi:hypothetical protein